MDPKDLSILDFTYHLPAEKIAFHPPVERDRSRLLVYDKGNIKEDIFNNITHYLPEGCMLIFNDTKVIKARIRFQKPTGGIIEIFCLEPCGAMTGYNTLMNTRKSIGWKCMIGGAGKWKGGLLEKKGKIGNRQGATVNEDWTISVMLVEKLADSYLAEFKWEPAGLSFAEILELAGDIPLPPYIKRKTEAEDTIRYQTVYAKEQGSVAAPTAGLHFTNEVFESLAKKNILTDFVTLHVGAGTFKPVKSTTMKGHEMHEEWINVHLTALERLKANLHNPFIAVGTTSARTLESIYWMGVKACISPDMQQLEMGQWEVYEEKLADLSVSPSEALAALIKWLKQKGLNKLFTTTQLMIAPGYRFNMINGIITNFHQPQSTLLLLVAAAIGKDWKKYYDHALQNGFRFLSYGDSCLIFINE